MVRTSAVSSDITIGAFVGAIISTLVVHVLSGAGPPPTVKETTTTTTAATKTTATPLPFCHELTTAFDPCTSNPCVTGVCTNLGDGQFRCSCTEGWHGTHCDTGFLCGDDGNTCLPFSVICNQTMECPNNFDEMRCCGGDGGHENFLCGGGFPACVIPDKLCDGNYDCQTDAFYDETYYCGSTCTIPVSARPKRSTPASTRIDCITTPLTSTSMSVGTTQPATIGAACASNAANSFIDTKRMVAAVFLVSGYAVCSFISL